GDHLTASASGFSESQDGVAGLAGGGIQWKVSGPWSVRGSADYVFTRHNIFGGPSVTQNNYRASAGIVYSFGVRREVDMPRSNSTPASTDNPIKQPTGAGMRLDALGVTVRVSAGSGAEITEVAPSGVAGLAGLREGDVINAIDG